MGIFTATKLLMTNPLIAKKLKVTAGLAGKTFIVQGFGNVGYFASKYFTGEGCKLIGIAEVDGSIYNPNGFDYQEVADYIKKNKGVIGFPGAEYFEN